jgi:hypothetical protein
MAAGGLSYSGLTSYGKATLPSVDSWGTNMNIAKDPPRSITTRRIDKVGQTSNITEMIDDSSNRACEAISYYARGVNPMVSVSYNNYGNSGGQSSALQSNGGLQAKLPYRIMEGGAFRPPLRGQEMLYPLSRLPRVWFSAFTQPGFADYTKKLRVCGDDTNTKEVKPVSIKIESKPTKVYALEQPIKENYVVKNVIQPVLHKDVNSGKRGHDNVTMIQTGPKRIEDYHTMKAVGITNKSGYNKFNHEDSEVFGKTHTSIIHAQGITNKSGHSKYSDHISDGPGKTHKSIIHPTATSSKTLNIYKNNDTHMDTGRYVSDIRVSDVHTNKSLLKNHTSIENIIDHDSIRVKNNINIEYQTPHSGFDKIEYIHSDIEMNKNLPTYSIESQHISPYQKNIQHENQVTLSRNMPVHNIQTLRTSLGNTSHSSRDYKLQPKINIGGFTDIQDRNGLYHTDTRANTDNITLNNAKIHLLQNAHQQENY